MMPIIKQEYGDCLETMQTIESESIYDFAKNVFVLLQEDGNNFLHDVMVGMLLMSMLQSPQDQKRVACIITGMLIMYKMLRQAKVHEGVKNLEDLVK